MSDNEKKDTIPKYVKDLHPIYQRARADGLFDTILMMEHKSGSLEVAEKLTSGMASKFEPVFDLIKKLDDGDKETEQKFKEMFESRFGRGDA